MQHKPRGQILQSKCKALSCFVNHTFISGQLQKTFFLKIFCCESMFVTLTDLSLQGTQQFYHRAYMKIIRIYCYNNCICVTHWSNYKEPRTQTGMHTHTHRMEIPNFNSVQDGISVLGKAYMLSTLSLRSFPNVTFETVPMFIWLTMALSCPFKENHLTLPLWTPLFSRQSMVWCPWLCSVSGR